MDIIPAKYYYNIYLFITIIFTVIIGSSINEKNNIALLYRKNTNFSFIIYVFILILFLGLRPLSGVFGDTMAYALNYSVMSQDQFGIDQNEGEWIWKETMFLFSKVVDVKWFFLFIEFIYIFPVYIACKRLSTNNYTFLLLFFISAYSFFSYGVNGIRNGMACSLVILALSYLNGDKRDKFISFILCYIAFGCHKSVALPIISMAFTYYYIKTPKKMFQFWISSIFISLVAGNLVESFFTSLGFDDRMTIYVGGQNSKEAMEVFSQTGFRWDFLLYSCMPIWLGKYLVLDRKIYNKTYLLLLGTYIYSNAFWIMVIRAAYSNRFAYLSWFIYPIVLAYPLIKLKIWPDQGKRATLIMIAHIGFTFLMWFRDNFF